MGLAVGLVALSTVMLISVVVTPTDATPFNVTLLLKSHPSLTQFNNMLTSTGVADEINARSSLTVLVVTDQVLTTFLAAYPNVGTPQVADLLRYQVLLEYLDIPELKTITTGNPSTVTTLYQTTGRAPGNSGAVNIYNDGTNILVGQANVNTSPNTTVIKNVTQIPYNISIIQIDNVLAPTGFGAATTAANITAILETGKNFNMFSSLLQSTGVDSIFASRETSDGITIFAPTDSSFQALNPGALSSLNTQAVKNLLEYHALSGYFTLGTLTTLNNPATPTVATVETGAGMYTLNVSTASTGVVISSGINIATISGTLYDTLPVVLFSIEAVLLPPALFTAAPAPGPALAPAPAPAPINGSVPVPAPAPLTPTPAPSPLSPAPAPGPLSPSPTPTPSSAPSPLSAAPTPVPSALPPGPPAPPAGPIGGVPTPAPKGSPGKSDAKSTSMSLAVLAATVLISVVML